ncbi:pentapeptide repeat-containing protein [Nocardiopsis flavescens]|uniref:pentapeptide repeat-containing protein n=1 Tax=Nocardiopsis flavescens TaxID=758803 RepID=UPI0036544279
MRSPTPRQWTGIVLIAAATTALTTIVWPLLAFLWGQLPAGWPVRRALTGVGLAAVLVLGVVLFTTKRGDPVRLWWLILAAWAVAIGTVAAIVFSIWLVLDTPGLGTLPRNLSPQALDSIATRAFAVVAGLGGVALLVINYRRQRTTEQDSQREVSKLFSDRFTTTYADLGSEHAAVRLGAVNALAHLADNAPSEDEAQMVIDVLCAYLRMPYTPRPEDPAQPAGKSAPPASLENIESHVMIHISDEERQDRELATQEKYQREVLNFESFREVRHSIIRIIGDRLRKETRWRGKNYDFTDAVFDGGDFTDTHFTGGKASFQRARFIGGTVNFTGSQFIGGKVNFAGAQFIEGTVYFDECSFRGGHVYFTGSEFTGGSVSFHGSGMGMGRLYFNGALFGGGKANFRGFDFTGGQLIFDKAQFDGGHVDFSDTMFANSNIVSGNRIIRGASFEEVALNKGIVSFDHAVGFCPISLSVAVAKARPGVVRNFPEKWRERSSDNPEKTQTGEPSAGSLE